MELRDSTNLFVNGSTVVGIILILCTCKCTRECQADVGGLMLDYHLDHYRLEREVEDKLEQWSAGTYDRGDNDKDANRSGSNDGPGTCGPPDRDK
jgi:hypothetical protein